MEISVKIPDELAAQAKARGLRVEEYVQELLAQQVQGTSEKLSIPKTEAEVRACSRR
jgi:post-segregation antitoxin (ccd killing protein)